MDGHQDLIVGKYLWQKILAVCEVTVFQGGIDGNFVITIGQF